MAKRRSTQPTPAEQAEAFEKRRLLLLKLVWGFIFILSVLYGYSHGYPIAAQGEVVRGVLIGLAYGGGAFILIGVALFLNRKLRGL
jgi:hypothetical protein